MPRGAAQKAAQHIAPSLVGRQHAVANHHNGGADVVGDDPQTHVGLGTFGIMCPGDLAHLVGDVHDGIHVEQRRNVLTDHRQTLQTHSGVDILILHLFVVALAVVDKLREDIVPDFDIPVALAAHGAVRLAAAVFFAPVVINFRAGTARPGAVLPEVVRLAEAENALGRDAHVLVPNLKGLVVVHIDRGIEPIRLQTHHLGQKLPTHGDGVLFKIVAKGEIAQHLKIGAVAGSLADVLNIAGADALLAGTHAVAGRLLLPRKPGLHGSHAAVDEQEACVVVGDQGKAGQAQVPFALKVAEEHLPQFVQPINRM
ncbi:hypothetical protein DSECCO2_532340 [anaerobic digester metagenome]